VISANGVWFLMTPRVLGGVSASAILVPVSVKTTKVGDGILVVEKQSTSS